MSTRATSLDVARRAGLSRSAVSQILNGNDERFPQETRDRVNAAAAELGYRPSRAGRALVTGVSDIIVVTVPNVTFGRHLQDTVDRIAQATASRGLSVVVRYAGDDPAATLTAILDLRPAAVVDMGVFMSREDRKLIEAQGTRIVPSLDAADVLREDPNHLVGRLQARHLMSEDDRRIAVALLDDDRPDEYGPTRLQGVVDELSGAGRPAPSVLRVPLERQAATAALERLLSEHPGSPVGICCYNDDVAIALLAAARKLGLAVPDRVALVGVDHTALGQLVDPPLTSVAVDMSAIVRGMLGDLRFLTGPADTEFFGRDFREFVRVVPGGTG
jgi:DNA-binding LacI/PurR family transcriptional regulator